MSIHPTAIINPKAALDPSVEVGPYCIIEANVRIGAGCRLYHGVYVTGWTRIGENCELHPGVIVGHAPQDTKYKGERSYCRIGNNCVLREYVTIHRGTTPESETVIGDDCFLLGGAHVAHNGVLGRKVTLINNVLLAGHVTINDQATLGGAAGVHQFVRIGQLAMVPGCGRLVMDVVPYALVDRSGRIAGINRVGLRRAGMSQDDVSAISNAYRVLFDNASPFSQRVERLEDAGGDGPVRTIIDFVRGETHRGIAGRTRRRSSRTAWEPDPA